MRRRGDQRAGSGGADIGCPDRCKDCSRGEPPVLPPIRRRPAEYRALMIGARAQGLLVAVRIRFGAVADAWSYSALRRLTVAWSVFFVIDAVSFVALSVWAFDRAALAPWA